MTACYIVLIRERNPQVSEREDVSRKTKWCEPGVRCKENGNRKDSGEEKMKDERETGRT